MSENKDEGKLFGYPMEYVIGAGIGAILIGWYLKSTSGEKTDA